MRVVEVSSDVSVLEVMLLVRVVEVTCSDVSVCTVLKVYGLCLSPPWYNMIQYSS